MVTEDGGVSPSLTFKWYSIQREIKAFFLWDKDVHTGDVTDSTDYTITCHDLWKALAVATVLKTTYDVSDLTGTVHVTDNEGNEVSAMNVKDYDDLMRLAQIAFSGNPRVMKIDGYTSPDGEQSLFAICEKALIQYYDDDLSDPYRNATKSTADVLNDILETSYPGGLTLKASTENWRDV